MAVLCIAGSGSGVGKTAAGCRLIRSMPEFRWLAVKVSPHVHNAHDGMIEEMEAGSVKDTGRYLAAGARRAFLATDTGDVLESVRQARKQANDCDAALIETGRLSAGQLAGASEEALTLCLLGDWVVRWKPGTLQLARSADALVLRDQMDARTLPDELSGMLSFRLPAGEWTSAALVDFARERFGLAHLPRSVSLPPIP